jgi:hypothetical protein
MPKARQASRNGGGLNCRELVGGFNEGFSDEEKAVGYWRETRWVAHAAASAFC